MLTNKDKAEILKMLAQVKRELRDEFNTHSNTHSEIENSTNQEVSNNTDAILELAEIVGGTE